MPEKRAIVIGGSLAGMCAARALSDFFDRVVVIERDKYPDGVADRKGVPQSKMYHVLLERGRQELEALFPGFESVMEKRGIPRMCAGFNAAILLPRGWLPRRSKSVVRGISSSRGLLESTVRDFFLKLPHVEVVEETDVTGLVASPRDNRMVCRGVEARSRSGGGSYRLEADLVVDASGGSAKASNWLRQLGLTPPEEEVLDPLLGYAGQWMRMREGAKWPEQWWWTHGVFIQRVPPEDIRGAHLMKEENDRWLLTIVGGGGHYPPTDAESIASFLGELRSPLITEMLPLFEPTSPIAANRLFKNRWRHYERWKENLTSFIALGDAACVFNPNQGQGMSVAAAEAAILRDCMKHSSSSELLPRRFFTAQAEFQINPWRLAVCNDLRFSYVQGRRTSSVRFFNWYRQRIALTPSPDVQRRVAEVEGLLRPVASLFEAAIARRVLASWIHSARFRFNQADAQFSPMPPTFAEGRS